MSSTLSVLYTSSDNSGLVVVSLLGAAAGVFFFFKGFSLLRYKRLILDTPLSKVRSASIGLVEVSGMPVGPHFLSAPVTGEPCYYYRVCAWQWEETDKERKWKQVLDESSYVPFFIDDGTGKVLVNAQGAEMDVHRDFLDEIGASFFRTPGLVPPNVRDFLAKRGLVPYDKIKVEEFVVKQGYPLFVFGTLGENSLRDGFDTTASGMQPSSPGFASQVGGALQFSFRSPAAVRAGEAIGKFAGQIPGVTVQRSPYSVSASARPSASSTGAAIQTQELSSPPANGHANNASGDSAVPNSGSPAKPHDDEFNLHASVAISKGPRRDPFTISSQSPRELVRSLAWKSAAYIWGGPVLTVICLYFLIVYFGGIP